MSTTETVNLTVSASEIKSVNESVSFIADKIEYFADKYGVGNQFDKKRTIEDLIILLVKKNVVRLEELEVSILDDGTIGMDNTVTGRRKADLIFRINYTDSRRTSYG